MAYNFTGQKILVTGAGRGIGRGIAINLAKSRAHVYALSLTQENLDALVKEIPAIVPIQHDLANWDETVKVIEKLDTLDGLVNCAAVPGNRQNIMSVPKQELLEVQSINVEAPINLMQIVGKKMVESGKGGSIVNISSTLSTHAISGLLPYCVSKAGLDMATKMFALELGPHNIRVNTVNPGATLTDMMRANLTEEQATRMGNITPMRRLNEVQDVLPLVLYLLSDKSKMITGAHHLVDGGLAGQLPS